MAQRRAAWIASFITFDGSGNVVVNTGKLNQHVERPDATTRLLRVPYVAVCAAS